MIRIVVGVLDGHVPEETTVSPQDIVRPGPYRFPPPNHCHHLRSLPHFLLLSHGFSQQIENSNVILASEKLKNSNKLVNTVTNTRINNARYELNTENTSDAQVEFVSDPDTPTTDSLTKIY